MRQVFNTRTSQVGTLLFTTADHAIVQMILPSGSILRVGWPLTETEGI